MAKNKGSGNMENKNGMNNMNSAGDMNGAEVIDQNKASSKKGNAAKNKGSNNNQSFR